MSEKYRHNESATKLAGMPVKERRMFSRQNLSWHSRWARLELVVYSSAT